MIFLGLGLIVFIIGLLFFIFPARKISFWYGYRTYLARQSQKHWQYAQKVSSHNFLLFGTIMLGIGLFLKFTGRTHFFLLEIMIAPLFLIPIFAFTETKLQKFDRKLRGEQNEYTDD